MLCIDNDLNLTGAVICGKTFYPTEEDSVCAVFDLDGCSCGVTVEEGRSNPYLRLTPGIQLPPEARDGFRRFQFEHDDDAMMDLSLDADDGEVTLRHDLENLDVETVADALPPLLDWVERAAYPALAAYVEECVRRAADDED